MDSLRLWPNKRERGETSIFWLVRQSLPRIPVAMLQESERGVYEMERKAGRASAPGCAS